MSLKLTVEPRKGAPATPFYRHVWVKQEGGLEGYDLIIPELFTAHIWMEEGGAWLATMYFGGRRYVADSRPSLEAAFKAVDRIMYKYFPHECTLTASRAIMAPWKGDLNL